MARFTCGICPARVPVIVVDQMETYFPRRIAAKPKFLRFRIAGIRAGEAVAELLLRQGHSHIAYLSSYPNLNWVQKRYEGLTRYAAQYGRPNS